jgi:cytochrome c556
MGSRPLDQDIWIRSSHRMQEASVQSAKAAETKDLAAWKTATANIGAACRSCHNVHKKKTAN